jgi:hypothetical protein
MTTGGDPAGQFRSSGRIGSVAELASLEGISDRYEAVASVVI